MRHGRRTDFTGDGFLTEVGHGDIGPDITIQVDEDGVPTRQGIKKLGHVVVRLDLGRKEVLSQAKFTFDHLFT